MLDMNFKSGIHNGNEGLFWMREIFKYDSNISVIIVTASGDIELAVKAIKEGAVDFILKPWDNSKLLATVNVAWQLRLSRLEASTLKKDNQLLEKRDKQGRGEDSSWSFTDNDQCYEYCQKGCRNRCQCT